MRMPSNVSEGGSDGTKVVGGINSHMFVKDGETLYFVRHPTCVFHSPVQMVHPLETCSHIHLPFRSLLIIVVKMASLQKMKRGYCSLSSSATASAISALYSLFRICRSSSWQSMRNSPSWNT